MTKSFKTLALAAIAALSLTGQALAQPAPGISLRIARVVATDLDKSVQFYKDVFGLQQVGGGSQPRRYVQLNFGDTVEDAKANKATQIMIGQITGEEAVDKVSHMAFAVPDTYAIVEKAKKAGGSVAGGPYEAKMPDATRIIAYINDPAGNQLEIISVKK